MYGWEVQYCIFFFQAEDGIRDKLVTGVQTCALPISSRPLPLDGAAGIAQQSSRRSGRLAAARPAKSARIRALARAASRGPRGAESAPGSEIGRASCRERV